MKKKKPIFRKTRKGGGTRRSGLLTSLVKSLFPLLFKGPVLFALLLFLAVLLLGWLTEQARRFPRFKVYPKATRCLGRPAWLASSERLTSEVVSEIQGEILARWPVITIFDQDLEEALLENPSSFSPWIESVESFERIYPSRYGIALKLRKPVATFVDGNRSYFIDGKGVVITPVDHLDRGLIRASVPRITEFKKAGEIIPGYPVRNRRLIEGAQVAQEIGVFDDVGIPPSLRIVEINVFNYSEGKKGEAHDVVLYTVENVSILWGRSSRHKAFEGIDPSPRQKALKLKKALDKFPGLKGLTEVNLTQDKVYVTPEDT